MRAIVTGGAGFIGSHLVKKLLNNKNTQVLTIDKLTYAGNLNNLESVLNNNNHIFKQLDIIDYNNIKQTIFDFKPDWIFNLAAESHVDRSINNASDFVTTNILGAHVLTEISLGYWEKQNKFKKFRFVQVSTDEVFGSVEINKKSKFTEKSSYHPNSPYSATKASADLLLNSYYSTYGFPVVIAHCSNNYGPNQYPEKLIPLCILNALTNNPLPIYGNGKQIRDWIYVTDHVAALINIVNNGKIGDHYCVGANAELENIFVVRKICDILDNIKPRGNNKSYSDLITFVTDRLGHDRHYAINNHKLTQELNWQPKVCFEKGLKNTIKWYLENNQGAELSAQKQMY